MSARFPCGAALAAPPAIRLFDPAVVDQGGPRLSPAMRLGEFFREYALPVAGKACGWAPGTIASSTEAVDYWSELTRDFSLLKIDAYETSEFVAGLRLLPGRSAEFMSTATVRKHCGRVQAMLNMAGPRVRHGKKDLRRFGAALIDDVPWIEAPEADEQLPDGDFTHEEVLAILGACQFMTTPHAPGVAAADWWTALVKFLCATGLRIGTAMALEWSMINRQLLCIPGSIVKKRRPHVQYLHPAAHAAILPLKGVAARVFPWPNWPRPGATRWLQRQRELLLERAGLAEARQFGFHGFRKYHATELYGADEDAARDSLGHKSGATTCAHYVNHRVQADAKLRRQQAAIDGMRLFN